MHLLNSVGVLFKINVMYCPEYSVFSKCTKVRTDSKHSYTVTTTH